MEQELTLVRIGHSARLERLLPQALAGLRVKELPPERIEQAAGCRLLFAAALGFFVFGEAPDWLSVLGYMLICGAGVGMFLYNRRRDAAHP